MGEFGDTEGFVRDVALASSCESKIALSKSCAGGSDPSCARRCCELHGHEDGETVRTDEDSGAGLGVLDVAALRGGEVEERVKQRLSRRLPLGSGLFVDNLLESAGVDGGGL